ncbi:NAD-dependent deacylase [bacterium]|nr:NAD-dependent deacylase [bacterium]
MRSISVLTGAGISAESGIATFRGSGGLWEGHDIREVATPEAWVKDYKKVLRFYNERRRGVGIAKPNKAHIALAELQKYLEVKVITQNIDHLHEDAGSKDVLHLHGEIVKARSSGNESYIVDIGFRDIEDGETCPDGYQMRPHIVWFGEQVPAMAKAAQIVSESDVLMVVGTSLEVYPAAGLLHFAPPDSEIILVDPGSISVEMSLSSRVKHFKSKASEGVYDALRYLGVELKK